MSAPLQFTKGLYANIVARMLWGAGAWYFALAHTTDDGLLFFHRLLWASVFCVFMMAIFGVLPSIISVARDRRQLHSLFVTSLLIASNWYVVIWCIVHGQVLSASLGFYLAPMVTVLLGHALMKERLSKVTCTALLLCSVGVALIVFSSKEQRLEWQALYIAASSAAYALLRKRNPVPPLAANLFESAIPLLAMLPWIAWRLSISEVSVEFWPEGNAPMYFVGLGIATTIPMIFYVYSLDKLPLSLIGYLQYISPSVMFFLGITVLGESITQNRVTGFVLVWFSIALHAFGPRLLLWVKSQQA